MTIRQETRTVFVTEDNCEWATLGAAEAHDKYISMVAILEKTDVYWRETGPADVAKELICSGYKIVRTTE